MNVSDILEFCQDNDIKMRVDDGKLKLLDRNKRASAQLIDSIKVYKRDLISIISGNPVLSPSDFPYSGMEDSDFEELIQQRRDVQNLYIATPMQEGMLFHGLLDGSGASYTTQTFCDLAGTIDTAAFKRAWQHVVNRHDILRTCFVGLETSQVHQLVLSSVRMPVTEDDIRSLSESEQARYLKRLRIEDKARGFDFTRAPLMRLHLIRVADDRYHFIWSRHHILLDGWCGPLIFNEVFSCYQAFVDGVEPQLGPVIPYERYIAWLFGKDKAAAREFWKDHLAGLTAPTPLILDGANGVDGEGGFRRRRLPIGESVSEALEALARQTRCTMNVVVQAAWAYVLHRYWGQADVVFGTTVSGRPAEIPGIEAMVGLFIDTIPIRVRFTPGTDVEALLHQIHADNILRDEAGYISLVDIHRQTELPNDVPLFNSLMTFENHAVQKLPEPKSSQSIDLSAQPVGTEVYSGSGLGRAAYHAAHHRYDGTDARDANYDLALAVYHDTTLNIDLLYRSDVFSEAMIQRVLGHIEHVLGDIARHGSNHPVDGLSMLPALERAALLKGGQNATEMPYPTDALAHAMFEAQVDRTPQAPAVRFEGATLSYAELNTRANRVAHALIERGVGPDTLVGLCAERSLEMVLGLLGILKAGGSYVPLDPDYPDPRLAYMLGDCRAEIVLTQASLRSRIDALGSAAALCLETLVDATVSEVSNPRVPGLRSDHLAYVIYTSGTTGQPKGVCTEHRALVNRLCWMQNEYGLGVDDRLLQKTPFSFDVSIWEFLWTLSNGATLEMARPGGHRDPEYLSSVIQSEAITTVDYVPSMLSAMLESTDWSRCTSVRRVFCGGEVLPLELVRRFFGTGTTATLHNLYGPTEAAIGVTAWACDAEWTGSSIPIGRPIQNVRLYVLDQARNVQPVGVPGELHIGGVAVARGYLNRPGLTAEKFIADPFSAEPGARLYRTGDLVRWLPDGDLEYLGRMDTQVKLRGNRIELSEIECVLCEASRVREAAVLVRSDEGHERLVAYLAPEGGVGDADGRSRRIAEWKKHLQRQLPDYMVPELYVELESLPLNNNGKLDRQALPVPDESNLNRSEYIAPRTEIESALCALWAEVLNVKRVGIADNFFALGGDSLISIRLVTRARQQGLQFSVRSLLEQPTVALLAPYATKTSGPTNALEERIQSIAAEQGVLNS